MVSENVIVVGRCRPFNEKEKAAGHSKVAEMDKKKGMIMLSNPKASNDMKTFSFDAVFDEDSTQVKLYKETGHKKFLVRVSFLEIYNEEVKDLLVKPNKHPKGGLDLKENPDTGVFVKDLSAVVVKSVEELEHLMEIGNKARSVGATLMNQNSSRSHSIFTITIESSEVGEDGEEKYISGKLNLVDLAGSERQSKTGATGDRLKEATKINLSLSALGNCISALVDGKSSHIPYRDSKLTRNKNFTDFFSPASYNYEETLSTLRYANRAKNIKNKPVINEDPKDAMLREYQVEIERLRQALEARQKGGTAPRVVTKIVKKTVKKKVKKQKAAIERDIDSPAEQIDPVEDGITEDTSEIESEDDEEEEEEEESDIEDTTENKEVNPLATLDPETIAKLQEEVEAEKRALLASKDMVVEERQRIAAELERRAADLDAERQEREMLALKLKAMEGKLLIGGVNIEEKINEQERILQETELRIQEEQRRERVLEKRLEVKQEAQLQLEENFSSLQEEVDVKTKKLKKLWSKLQEVKEEINDVKDEFRIEREDLLDTIRELSRELALKMTITENFIPLEEQMKLEKQTVYNEEKDDWTLKKITARGRETGLARPISVPTIKRPVCQYVKLVLSMGDPNLRYRGDNIATLQLELPERTTLQNEAPRKGGQQISPLQGALDYVLSQDTGEVFVSSDLLGEIVQTSAEGSLDSLKKDKTRSRSSKGYPSAKNGRSKRYA
ncbi:Kinesin-like protein kif3b [Globomyces sp. JEL0801]|nr:Kinesin-like protein kif3b [Globomyces sp. JEL0801]